MSDYCEIPEFYSATWVKGRKEHKCCECGGPIEKGELHGYFVGKWDGELNAHRQHLDCELACRYIRDKIQGGECICFGELFDAASNYLSYRTDEFKDFRRVMARVKFRRAKGRAPGFLQPLTLAEIGMERLQKQRDGSEYVY